MARWWIAGVMVSLLVAMASAAAAQSSVTAAELLARPAAYHHQEVELVGELVGDYAERRSGTVWTQLNDDPYVGAPLREGGPFAGSNVGIGVRIPPLLAEGLDDPGGYRRRGPVVAVTGLWVYHDPARGGESYLEVVSLRIVEPGRELSEDVNPAAGATGAVLVVAAGLLFMVRRGRGGI